MYMNFLLQHEHNFDAKWLEELQPWEREVYINMLIGHIKKKKEMRKQNA